MLLTAIVITTPVIVLLAIGFVGWIIWEANNAPELSEVDENRLAERIRKACEDEMADLD